MGVDMLNPKQENFVVHLCNRMDYLGTDGEDVIYLLRVDPVTNEVLSICGADSADDEPEPLEAD